MESGAQHLLALKVMRVSRPSIATAWEPFYSSSPAFSAHSTASILSLQGREPLPGHPKTLRDLSVASELLVLPASFGQIQLGETFASCLAVNNEAAVDIEDVVLRVEIQTTTNKVVLAEFGVDDDKATLAPGGTMECVVSHEIKELGQHVLACTVSYRTPAGARLPAPPPGSDPNIQVFRKFYKFAVINPLSVKTKVHVPRSPSAILSETERVKVFLEVHITNLTQEPLWFERLGLQPVDGWSATDLNSALHPRLTPEEPKEEEPESLFTGATALMQPHDVRQYVYVLTPSLLPSPPRSVPVPGAVIPLGRLDISWRSTFGEPGRLLTSMLSRRIPLPPAPPPPPKAFPAVQPAAPVPALPPHLQAVRPAAPASARAMSPGPGSRPSSPGPRAQSPFHAAPGGPELELELLAAAPARVELEQPFQLVCTLALAASRPRAVRLAIQRACGPVARPPLPPSVPEPFTPRLPSGLATPTAGGPTHPAARADALAAQLLVASPRALPDAGTGPRLPPAPPARYTGVRALGASTVVLPSVHIELDSQARADDGGAATLRAVGTARIELGFMPLRRGVQRLDGLRVFVLDDHAQKADDEMHGEWRLLGEWDAVGEVWVMG